MITIESMINTTQNNVLTIETLAKDALAKVPEVSAGLGYTAAAWYLALC